VVNSEWQPERKRANLNVVVGALKLAIQYTTFDSRAPRRAQTYRVAADACAARLGDFRGDATHACFGSRWGGTCDRRLKSSDSDSLKLVELVSPPAGPFPLTMKRGYPPPRQPHFGVQEIAKRLEVRRKSSLTYLSSTTRKFIQGVGAHVSWPFTSSHLISLGGKLIGIVSGEPQNNAVSSIDRYPGVNHPGTPDPSPLSFLRVPTYWRLTDPLSNFPGELTWPRDGRTYTPMPCTGLSDD
jgi:hypothetical protein